jgi:hypothetical protein
MRHGGNDPNDTEEPKILDGKIDDYLEDEEYDITSTRPKKGKQSKIPYDSIESLVTKFMHQKLHKKNGVLRWADPNCQEPDFLLGKKIQTWLSECKSKGDY